MVILGGGITGLSTGINLKAEIYEASSSPGGICASYYMTPEGRRTYSRNNEESYRFEIGGGHWIFGDKSITNFINSLSYVKSYERKSAVYLSENDLYVPYPLQNHLSYLPKDIANKALREIKKNNNKSVSTLADWLELNFGKTLCEIFFFPFHQLYTAGLYTKIAPQDQYKTPVNKELIIRGLTDKTPPVGYNVKFVYPRNGLDDLIRNLTKKCKINYNKKVVKIDVRKKEIFFEDGTGCKYKKIISTLPLSKMLKMTGLKANEPFGLYTSVLVVNIGAKRGKRCPDYHWLYIPRSKAGFHRVGFYSNVDNSFLPLSLRKDNERVNVYVEKAYRDGEKPKDEEIKKLCNDIIEELKNWNFITDIEIIDFNWIEVAYTWQYLNSQWREKTLEVLKKNQIYQIGRYGKWKFQGIAGSIKDSFVISAMI